MLLQPYVKWNGRIIALSDGHGLRTAGKRTPYLSSIGRFIHENEFNRAVVAYLAEKLRRLGFKVLLVAPSDEDTPLKTRVDLANAHKVDAYVSIHFNAMDGKFDGDHKDPSGISIHIDPNSTRGRKLAETILKHLKEGTVQKNRGIVEQSLYETRETKMVAVLSENGFMDNEREAKMMLNTKFQNEVATEHAKGICEYFDVKYAPAPVPKPVSKPKAGTIFYRVVTGSFESRENAEVRIRNLKGHDFESFLEVFNSEQTQYFRVVTGSFTTRKNAEEQQETLLKSGFESFVSAFHK
jgi:N-acetylmuramoyl-L-alanine amidase